MQNNEIDIDLILSKIGDFGRYQIISYLILSIPMFFIGATTISYVFTAGNIDYRCKIPKCEEYLIKHDDESIPNILPSRNMLYSKCSYYDLEKNISENAECSYEIFDKSIEVKCNSSNLVFKNDEKTIVNEFGLFCEENEWKLALVGTLNSFGVCICLPIAGYLSDRFGRRFILLFSLMSKILFGLLRSISINYWMFLCFEMLDAGLSAGGFGACIVFGMEILSPSRRLLGCTILATGYTLGLTCLGVLAMISRNFRILLQIIYAPMLILISYFWLLPESMRWLISKRKFDKVNQIVLKIAKINKLEMSDNELLSPFNPSCNKKLDSVLIESEKINDANSETIFILFKTPFLLFRLVNTCFCTFTTSLVYYGLSINSVNVVGDKYINFILSSMMEIPGFVLFYFILDRCGRRWSLCLSLIISGGICIFSKFLATSTEAYTLIVYLIGKSAITISFNCTYLLTIELYPTNLRHLIISISSMFGGIGSMVAPFSILLNSHYVGFSLLLFGCTSLAAGLFALFFPETSRAQLPNTVEESRKIGR